MVDFGDVGRICLNREMSGVCENCLWWEWDSSLKRCVNAAYPVCPRYREQLFNANAAGLTAPGSRPGGAGSIGLPAATAGAAGMWLRTSK
jgi:hypothetical protein